MTFKVFKSNSRWRWFLQIDGKVVARYAESFSTQNECVDSVKEVKKNMSAPIVILKE